MHTWLTCTNILHISLETDVPHILNGKIWLDGIQACLLESRRVLASVRLQSRQAVEETFPFPMTRKTVESSAPCLLPAFRIVL